MQRNAGELTLRFTARSNVPAKVTLHQDVAGRWSGNLLLGDVLYDVTLRRTAP